jgi:Family of unknown function (DUF6982)
MLAEEDQAVAQAGRSSEHRPSGGLLVSVAGKLVAVRYKDGRVLKGFTADFYPQRPLFHVTADGSAVPVRFPDLKAVFFIRTPGGDPSHEERKDFSLQKTPEREIWVQFKDGEELAGWSSSFASAGAGFYIAPTDPSSNMERAYVLRAAVAKVLHGHAAEEAAKRYRERAVKG